MHICSFSCEAAELKKADRTADNVLKALSISPRISTWDMSELPWLREVVYQLEEQDMVSAVDEPYPWHRWDLTPIGRAKIAKMSRRRNRK